MDTNGIVKHVKHNADGTVTETVQIKENGRKKLVTRTYSQSQHNRLNDKRDTEQGIGCLAMVVIGVILLLIMASS